MSRAKPRVKYIDAVVVKHMERASILLPEPRGWVRTSAVQLVTPTPNGPIIETLNTVYVPYDQDNDFKYKKYGHRLAA